MPETFIYKGVIRRGYSDQTTTGTPPVTISLPFTNGFSSTYYLTGSTIKAAWSRLDAINTAEMGLYGSQCKVQSTKVSDVGIRGDSYSEPVSTLRGTFTTDTTSGFTDGVTDANLALAVRFKASAQYRFTKFLRGLQDFFVHTLERSLYETSTNWITAYNAYTKEVSVDAVHLVIGVDPSGNKTYNTVPIDGWSILAAGKQYQMSIRRCGRPFDLPRGRRTAC